MREKILEICKELCCREVSAEEELIVTGMLNSFKIMELIYNLENEFDIVLLPDEISNLDYFSNVSNIEDLIKKKVENK